MYYIPLSDMYRIIEEARKRKVEISEEFKNKLVRELKHPHPCNRFVGRITQFKIAGRSTHITVALSPHLQLPVREIRIKTPIYEWDEEKTIKKIQHIHTNTYVHTGS